MRVSYTFDEVSLIGIRNSLCPVCGKSASRRQKFFQTLNPYNRNADGNPKTRQEIYKELQQQIQVWEREPATHKKCETQNQQK